MLVLEMQQTAAQHAEAFFFAYHLFTFNLRKGILKVLVF